SGTLIGGNRGDGVHLDGTGGGISNAVQGNHIGTDPTGLVALGNQGNGVFVGAGAVNDSVGGTVAGAGNTIADNHGSGVLIGRAAGAWGLALSAGQVSVGQRVTATATTAASFGAAAETSEFAANTRVS